MASLAISLQHCRHSAVLQTDNSQITSLASRKGITLHESIEPTTCKLYRRQEVLAKQAPDLGACIGQLADGVDDSRI